MTKREVLYRAISMCKGERWLYGQPRHYNHNPHTEKWTIYDPATGIETDIDEETLCQYTGVVDRLGKQVFEDDIIGYTDTDTGKTKIFGVVKWYHEGNFYINTDTYCNYTSDNDCANVGYMMNRATTKLHVIGNIHDNPELLKGGKQ